MGVAAMVPYSILGRLSVHLLHTDNPARQCRSAVILSLPLASKSSLDVLEHRNSASLLLSPANWRQLRFFFLPTVYFIFGWTRYPEFPD